MENPWLLVALGGALGATLRYGVWRLAVATLGATWPIGTATVNIVGSLILGFVVGLGPRGLSPEIRLFVGTGMLGAFTTFSTFSVETVELAERGEVVAAAGNVAGNVIVGVTAAVVGLYLARTVSQG